MTTSMVMTRTSIMTARVIVAIDEDWADECNYQLLQMCYLSLFSLPYTKTKRKDSVVLVLTLTYLCNISYSLSSYSQLRFALFHFKLPLYQGQEKGLGSTYFNTVSWVLLSRLVLQMCHLSFLASLVQGPRERTWQYIHWHRFKSPLIKTNTTDVSSFVFSLPCAKINRKDKYWHWCIREIIYYMFYRWTFFHF